MKYFDSLLYEIDPRDSPDLPPKWERYFGRRAPLALEIGCGNGEYLVAWGRQFSHWNFIGIELSLAASQRAQKRIFQQQLTNIRMVRDDARFVLHELIPDESVQQVIMNFPDPWPKKRHQGRRLLNPDFIINLAAVLVADGIFELYTDQLWYAQETRRIFIDSGYFRVSEITENPLRPVSTKYERKWREERRNIFQLRAVKTRSASLKRILEKNDMPHYFIRQEIPFSKIIDLTGLERKEAERVFKIKEVFCSPDERACLLRTVTVDKDYIQNFFILVARQEQGHIVKIDLGFQPYRTPAVRMALQEIAGILKSHPDPDSGKRQDR